MTTIYRAVVRGQFADLDDAHRTELRAHAAEHDYFHSAFTKDGTFTYDEQVVSFNLRYELRFPSDADDASSAAAEQSALERAKRFLDAEGLGYKRLRANVTDMASMWRD
ncbi:MAG: DUF6204 family protein [Acidimicrobiales bacterium]